MGLTKAQRNQILTTTEITSATKALTVGQIEERIATELNSKEDAKAITQKLTKIGIISSESGATTSLTVDILEQAVANGTLTASEASSIASALGLTVANTSLSVSFKVLTSTIWANIKALLVWLTTNPVGWAILATSALYGLAKVFVENTTSIEEAKEETKKYVDTLSSINSEVENLESRLKDLNNQINNLNPITDAEDIEKLKLESAELENQLAILKEKQRLASIEADKNSQASLNKTQTSRYEFGEQTSYNPTTGGDITYKTAVEVTRMQELQNAMNAYDEYAKKQSELRAELAKMAESGNYTQEEWDNLEKSIGDLDNKMHDARVHASELSSELIEEKAGLNGADQASKDLIKDTENIIGVYNDWTTKLNTNTESLKDNADAQIEAQAPKWDFSETISNLDTAKEKLSVLDETYAKLFDGDDKTNINFDDFSAINEAFSDVSGIENYIQRLQEAGNNTEQVTAVMEDLIDAYLQQSGILDNVTNENKELVVTMLQEMGVANAEQIVMAQLSSEKAILDQVTQILTSDTEGEIEAFFQEINASEETKVAMSQLALEKINVNNSTIDTSADIANIIALAETASASTVALAKLAEAKRILGAVEKAGGINKAIHEGVVTGAEYSQARETANSIENGTFDYGYDKVDVNKIYNNVKNVRPTYSPQKTPGTSSYDAVEKAADKANKAAKESAEELKDTFEETVDFFEERIEEIDNAYNLLSANLKNVSGSFAKNKLIDAQIGLNAEKINNYTDAMAMYTQKANEALSKLPSDIAEKVKNGAVDLTTFVGEGNEDVVDAVKEYDKWADKVAECKQELAELKTALRELELEKFNNIMKDFSDKIDFRDDAINNIDKAIALFEESGQVIGESFYREQISQEQKKLALYEQEKAKLAKQLADALSSGRIEKGSDEWLEMVNALNDVEGKILDSKTAIEEFDNAILNVHTETFNRVQKEFEGISSEIDNLIGLFDDAEVSDDKGNWTKEGLAQIGLYAQQYELAQHQVAQYDEEIARLNEEYANGKYSATEYADKLAELKSAQWDAVNASEAAKDSIVELNEVRVEKEIESIEKEKDAYKELIDAQLESLDAAKDLHDYKKSMSEKTEDLSDLQAQREAMENDTSAATMAKKALLDEEIAEKKKEIEEAEYDHSIETQKNALNKEYEDFTSEKDAEIEKLRQSLQDREALIAQSYENVKANAKAVGDEIDQTAKQHGITTSRSIILPWRRGSNAIASYGKTLTSKSSAFVEEIGKVESKQYDLQVQTDTAASSMITLFSTQADTLISELNDSYTSEQTLNVMTNALKDSLVNTLERGYNINGITSALNSISSSAESAASSIERMNNALANQPSVPTPTTETQKTTVRTDIGADGKSKYSIVPIGSTTPIKTFDTREEAMDAWKNNRYASGTRNAKGGIRVVDEEGKELQLPKLSSGRYEIGNPGDQILTKEQTDMIYKWSQLNPDILVPNGVRNMVHDLTYNQPQIVNRHETKPITVNNSITFTGDINDTNHFTKQITGIINKQLDKSFREFASEVKL